MFPGKALDTLEIITNFPHEIVDIPTVWIPMSDGIRLAARIWRPVDAEQKPVPAILEYIPYRRRDGRLADDERIHPYFAGHGFASIRVDIRGSGDSEGLLADEYLKLEQDDALEIICWLVKQPWCDGNVGMMGLSWGGFNSLQVAARTPRALKAIIAVGATVDRYNDDVHYKNGSLLNENLGWGSGFFSFSTRPPDPDVVGPRWRDMWLERLQELPFFVETWLEHQLRDDYWKHGSVCESYDTIKAPVMIITGWGDSYVNAVPRLLENLTAPCRAIAGPWAHQYPHLATPGPAIDFLGEALRWWTHWLKGLDTGVMDMPAYRTYCQQGSRPDAFADEVPGCWIVAGHWPDPNIEQQVFYLTAKGLSAQREPAPTLSICSPLDVGTTAGEFIPHCLGPEMPQDQRADDGGSLVFDTTPLETPLDIWGDPLFEIMLSSNCETGNLIIRLCDVGPDGASERVTFGVLNLNHRNGNETPSPMPPEQPVAIKIALDHVAHRFPKGHRIRLALSTAYWPIIWPAAENPTLTLAAQPARILLPVRTSHLDTPEIVPDPPTAPIAPNIRTLRSPQNQRRVIKDQTERISRLEIFDDYGELEFSDHGMINSGIKRESYQISWDDPLSATADFHWTQELKRGTWQVRTETFTHLECDQQAYHLTARVVAYEGDREVIERTWQKSIRRY